MYPYFFDGDIEKIKYEFSKTKSDLSELIQLYLSREYATARGREFALHGFSRRLKLMMRAAEVVFEKLPPEMNEIPNKDAVSDATLMLHAFVMNAFGCLDNLAWIWVCEKGVRAKNDAELSHLRVGLGAKCEEVRNSFSKEFVEYLEFRQSWVDDHLKGLRDSLAHRIPMYIPPYIIKEDDFDKYHALEIKMTEALRGFDFDLYNSISEERLNLGFWRPWMTHSVIEKSPRVVFHVQVIADLKIIIEFGRELLSEFSRHSM